MTQELEPMTQTAPYPQVLADLVEMVHYKPRWTFWLEDMDRGQGSQGLTLVIKVTVPDSYQPDSMRSVLHYFIVPAASYSRRSWQRWLFDQVLLVEQHEACEFFQVDEQRVYAPHHFPGADPYTIFEVGTWEEVDTNFRGERVHQEQHSSP